MDKELVGILKDKNNVQYKLYSNGKAYKVEDGMEIECTEYFKSNISNLFDKEECDIIETSKKYTKSRIYKISDPPEIE